MTLMNCSPLRHPTGGSLLPAALAVAVLITLFGTGCTSVLTTASLRDLVWDGEGHAAEQAPDEPDGDADAEQSEAGSVDAEATAEADAQRREAAIDEATERLARLDHLDDAARATLVETLDSTQPEDWPAVIDAFAESLAGLPPSASAVAAPPDTTAAADAEPNPETSESPAAEAAAPEPELPDAHVVAKAELDAAATDAEADAPRVTVAPEPPSEPASPVTERPSATEAGQAGSADDRATAAPAAAEPLMIKNACFASRVQAWGVLDRFAADRFRPGQEVIVYFELDGLSAGESPVGHTTCIDSELRLVDAAGSVIHAWSFEPIAETCRARRRDYFARYVVRLPEQAPAGGCRVELEVTDTLSGQVATASLPLEVLPDAGP